METHLSVITLLRTCIYCVIGATPNGMSLALSSLIFLFMLLYYFNTKRPLVGSIILFLHFLAKLLHELFKYLKIML